jgi:cytochrome b6-f complex iron-sulfur subunit
MSEPTSPPPPKPAAAAGAVTATLPAPPAAPKVVVPPKPAAAKPAPAEDRREFFVMSAFAAAWIAFSGTMLAMTLGTVRFLFPNVLSEPPTTFRAGDMSNFEPNKVDDKFKEVGAWVIRARDERNRDVIYALSTTCTHLGCTPNWLEGDKKFKCPCHGSGFRISGVNFEGPAPRPLERYAIRKTDDGQIIVDKSRKFQKELGQWEDVDSYLIV